MEYPITLRIKNFRSLEDVTLQLNDVNLFVGPNNSGKTNVFKALQFFGRNISERFIHKHDDEVSKNAPKGSEIYVSLSAPNGEFLERNFHKVLDRKSALPEIFDFFVGIKDFYAIRVDEVRKATPHKVNLYSVQEDGSNLPSFIDFLDNNHPDILEKIKADFTDCIPEFINFKIPVWMMNRDVPMRKLKFFDALGNSFWADEVSDGVLYFLALVCIIHQPNPPKLLLLEEPENGIHPRRISKIIDYIFDLAEKKQIMVIMTTHSPVVLDEFKNSHDNVFIFDRNETTKSTDIVRLSDFVGDFNRKAEENKQPLFPTDTLGTYWLSGLINGVPKR